MENLSARRLREMLEAVGLDPSLASNGELETIMGEVRERCQRCQSGDVCDRWLAGEKAGSREFCPNAKVFDILRKYSDV